MNQELDINRIIEMAWEDRTPLDIIYKQFNINDNQLVQLMRKNLNSRSFKNWRKRINCRKTKHSKNHLNTDLRFKCYTQNKPKQKKD